MSDKEKQQKNLESPRPPELEFFDKPPERGEKTKKFLRELLKKPWARFLLIIAGVLVLAVSFLNQKTGQKTKEFSPAGAEDKRTLVTTSSMEHAIDASSKPNTLKNGPKVELRSEKQKRKFNSAIAVFVSKPEKTDEISSGSRQREEKTKLGLPSGTKVPALLTTRVFSFNIAAPVIVLVSKDFVWKDKIVIPKGSQFLGQADTLKSIDRINVRFDRLIFPDGREIRVRAMALSEDGSAGLKGKVEKHTDRKLLKAVAETAVGTAALLGGSRTGTPYSLEDQARSNLFENLTGEARREINSTKIETSITVEAYVPLSVLLLEAI